MQCGNCVEVLCVHVGKLLPCHIASVVVRRVAAHKPEGGLSVKRFSRSCVESWAKPNTKAGAVEHRVLSELVSGHLFGCGLGDGVHFGWSRW